MVFEIQSEVNPMLRLKVNLHPSPCPFPITCMETLSRTTFGESKASKLIECENQRSIMHNRE
jgi:hypothetical protein